MAYEAPDENMLKKEQLKLDIYTKAQPIIGRLKKAGVDVSEFETEINGILPDRGLDLTSGITAVPKMVGGVVSNMRDGKSFGDALGAGADILRKEIEPLAMTSRKVITDYVDTAKDFFNMPKIETPERKLNEIQYKQSMATNPVSTIVRDIAVDPSTYVMPSSKLLQAESKIGRFAKGASVNAPIVGGSYALREGGKDDFSLENALIATGAGGLLGGLLNIPFGKIAPKAKAGVDMSDEEKARRMMGDMPSVEVVKPFNQQVMDDWAKFQNGEMSLEELHVKYQQFQKQLPNKNAINLPPPDGWKQPLGNRIQEALDAKSGNEISQKNEFFSTVDRLANENKTDEFNALMNGLADETRQVDEALNLPPKQIGVSELDSLVRKHLGYPLSDVIGSNGQTVKAMHNPLTEAQKRASSEAQRLFDNEIAPRVNDNLMFNPRAGFAGSPIANTIVAGGAGSTAPIDYNQDGEVSMEERGLSALLASVGVNIPSLMRNTGKAMQKAKEAPNGMRNGMIVGATDDEAGAFTDLQTKKVMREIDDSWATTTKGTWGTSEDMARGNTTSAKLGEILTHDSLFEKYPALKNVNVRLVKDMKGASIEGNKITVGYKNNGEIDIDSLLHEVQHAVQEIDSLPRGGSKEMFIPTDGVKKQVEAELKGWTKMYNEAFDKLSEAIAKGDEKEIALRKSNLDWHGEKLSDIQKNIDLQKDPRGSYLKLYGEQQARATAYRKDMTPEQRAKESWQQTLERVEGKYDTPIVKYDDGVAMSVKEVRDEFSSFKDMALKNGRFNGSFDFGLLSDSSVQKLKEMTGLNFSGYTRVVNASDIRHTKNSHPEDLYIYEDLIDIFEHFDYAQKTPVGTKDKRTGKPVVGVELYRKNKNGLIEYVELRDFNNKKLELKTTFTVSKELADQKLPRELRLWTDADYRSKSPQPSRLKTDSDGFNEKILPQSQNSVNKLPSTEEDKFFNDVEKYHQKNGLLKDQEYSMMDISDRERTRLQRAQQTIDTIRYEAEDAPHLVPDFNGFVRQYKDQFKYAGIKPIESGNKVKVFRSATGEIEAGDWVGLDKAYANSHSRTKEHKVYEKWVNKEDIRWQGNDANEWIYLPKKIIDKAINENKALSINPSLGVPAVGAGLMATSEQLKADDGSMSPLGSMLAMAGAGALAYKFGGKALDVANKVGSKAITSTAKVMDDLTANRISKTWDNFTSNRIVDAFLGTKIYKLDDYMKMRGDYTKSLNPTLETLEKLHVQLAEFSPQTREAMYDYMTGVKGVQLPTNLKKLADGFTKEIDTLSQELVKYGALTQEQANAFKGQYLHRQYTSKMKDLFSFGGDRKTLSDVKHRGRAWEGSEAEYNTYLRSGALGDFVDGKIVAQQQANGKYKFYQDWSPGQRAKWGEVKDVAFSIPETMSMLHERLENAKFLNAIAGDVRYVAPATMSHEDAISNGYVKLEGKRYGQLSGKYVIPEIASDIKAFADVIHGSDGQFAGISDAWKKAVSYLKSTHTIYSPTAHVNNLMSNLTFQFAEGVNNPIKMVANFTKGAIAHRKANELLRLEAIGKVRNLTPDEAKSLSALSIDDDVLLFKEAKLKGLFGKSQLNDTLNQYIKPRTQYKDGLMTKIHQKAGSIYGAEDDMMRFSLLKTLKEMNPNQSIDTLIDRVNNTIPDYSKPMSSVARKLRDTGFVPFIGFTYHAMPIMLRQMKERPASVAALAGMMGVIYAANDINPLSDEDIPDEGYAFKRLPIMQNGNIVTTIKVDKWIPHYDMLSSMTDFSQGVIPEFARSQLVGGIPQNLVGGLINYNPYFNQRVTQKEGAQKAYQLGKYNVQQVTPDILDNAYNLAESKLLDTKTRRYNKVIEPRSTWQEVARNFGVNIQSYNKAEQSRKSRNERVK